MFYKAIGHVIAALLFYGPIKLKQEVSHTKPLWSRGRVILEGWNDGILEYWNTGVLG